MENERDFKGIWIPKEIWLNDKLTLQEKLFLVEIDSLDNEDGCYANNHYFAEFFDISKTRVSIVISSLVEKGLISSEVNRSMGNKRILKTLFNKSYIPSLTKVKDPLKQKLKDNNIINTTMNNKEINVRFEQFWNLIPTNRRREKQKCQTKFTANCHKAKDPINEADKAIQSYRKYIKSEDFAKNGYKYVQLSTTWINKWDLDTWLEFKPQTLQTMYKDL